MSRLISSEFEGVWGKLQGPIHCEFCNHVVRKLGLWAKIVKFVENLLGADKSDVIERRAPLALDPPFTSVQAHEMVVGSICLGVIQDESDDKQYTAQVDSVRGKLTLSTNLGAREQNSLEAYRDGHKLTEGENIPFHLGFAALRGAVAFPSVCTRQCDTNYGSVFPLTGNVASDPILSGASGRSVGPWDATFDYQLPEDTRDKTSLPIRIVPYYTPNLEKRGLQLEIQWPVPDAMATLTQLPIDQITIPEISVTSAYDDDFERDHSIGDQGPLVPILVVKAETGYELVDGRNRIAEALANGATTIEGKVLTKLSEIKLLELQVPIAWGSVESASDSPLIGSGSSEDLRSITWERLPITPRDLKEGRREFSISFEHPMSDSEQSETDRAVERGKSSYVNGRMEVLFDGSLYGLTAIELYDPLGRKRTNGSFANGKLHTEVALDFKLSLGGLKYHYLRIVPDPRRRAEDEERKPLECPDLIPDYSTVRRLVNATVQDDPTLYIKRIIENAPTPGKRAETQSRSWDIAGRRYDGVYPISFEIRLAGEEIFAGGNKPERGASSITINVRGTYSDVEMRREVAAVWERLKYEIQKMIETLPKTSPKQAHGDPRC